MIQGRGEGIMRLSDGRRLGYAEYGEPQGWPLMFFHGTPGSRIMARFAGPKARELGVRLIAPDRPGFGRSDFQPHRRLLDWPRDVEELADALNLEKFSVTGVSGGGPYVAACAWKMGERLSKGGIISGLGPADRVWRELGLGHRFTALMMRQSGLINPILQVLAWGAQRRPEMIIKAMGLRAFGEDRRILSEPIVQATQIDSIVEAFRGGPQGTAYELELFSRPWGFEVEDIKIPVYLWHGEADAIVPVSLGRYLADHIPYCQARFIPKAGHLWIFEGYEEIFQVLQGNIAVAKSFD
jgi:pimeloyl-ACP methyl ester carboxylesterase